MKVLRFALLFMVLGAPAARLWAEDPDDRYLAQCRVELSERYGSEPDIKLVSKRRSGNRLRLKVAVTLPPRDDGLQRSEFATCLVARSNKPASP